MFDPRDRLSIAVGLYRVFGHGNRDVNSANAAQVIAHLRTTFDGPSGYNWLYGGCFLVVSPLISLYGSHLFI